MRSRSFASLMAAALVVGGSAPVWAQPAAVGNEFQVNQNKQSQQLQPIALFNASGKAVIVWENDIRGVLGRIYDRGRAATQELTLVANNNLPGIPARGEVLVRKDPAAVALPNGEMMIFWTEEKDFLTLDHFYENRKMLDQDILGQRFSAAGAPIGGRFRVNSATEGFQRRPKAALKPGGVVVVWESSADGKNSASVQARTFNFLGRPTSNEARVDSGRTPEIWNTAVAANAAGEVLVVWESLDSDGPGVAARFYRKDGAAGGSEFFVNGDAAGRQRRPAVVATESNDFLVAWQGFRSDSDHAVYGQIVNRTGARAGNEIVIGRGPGEIQVAPALARLASGGIVALWMDWVETWPIGAYAAILDAGGKPTGPAALVSQDRLYPQYRMSVAAGPDGDIVATWESRLNRGRGIAARRLAD